MSESRQRLFLALWPPSELARQLRQSARRCFNDPHARLLNADQIHLTLAYLGPATAEQQACVEDRAAQWQVPPFNLTLSAVGYWPRPKVGWIAPATIPPALSELVQQLQQDLPACGFQIEPRPWQAHITLLRKLRRAPGQTRLEPALHWPVNEFVLVASRTLPQGAEYRILRRWSLPAAGDG